MSQRISAVLMTALLLFSGVLWAKTSEFPYRHLYPDVQMMELDELGKGYNKYTIVDVRSRYEYETLHVKGAENVPLNSPDFADKVRALINKHKKTVVFYCNGKTCQKSYKAALRALNDGLKQVAAYDAGIFDWAKKYPDNTVLLGESPINPKALISKKDLKARMLKPKDFESKIGNKTLVIDVRDRVQRDVSLFPFQEEHVQLDDVAQLNKLFDKAHREKKTLLIYDKVGKQVRWLQYRLEARGMKDYYFMQGGSDGYFSDIYGKVTFGKK